MCHSQTRLNVSAKRGFQTNHNDSSSAVDLLCKRRRTANANWQQPAAPFPSAASASPANTNTNAVAASFSLLSSAACLQLLSQQKTGLSTNSPHDAVVGRALINYTKTRNAVVAPSPSPAPLLQVDTSLKLLQTLRNVIQSLPSTEKSTIDFCVLAMKTHPHCLALQKEGCTAIRHYVKTIGNGASSSSARSVMMDRECLSVLLHVLALVQEAPASSISPQAEEEISYVQYLALDCIRVASRDSASRLLLAEEPQNLRIIFKTLERSPRDARLQELGLSLLSYLVEEDVCRKLILQPHQQEDADAAANHESSGINSIIRAMKDHASNSLIQCNGAAALCWLVHLEHRAAKAALLANPDAVRTILSVSERFVENGSVFGNCICILCGIRVGDVALLQTYPELGTPTRKLLQKGMRRNPTSLKVQRNCMMLLRLVTESSSLSGETSNTANAPQTSDDDNNDYEDCIDAVMDCMKHFAHEADMQSMGCRILANLVAAPTNTATTNANNNNGATVVNLRSIMTAKEGCINLVTSALMKHKTDARVQQGACWFLHGILQGSVGQAGPAAFGGGLAVLEIMLEGLGVELNASENENGN